VLGLDADGRVVHNLQDDGARYHYVTGVREHDGWLYLGSLVETAVARVRLPEVGA
jgi:strictosidine synthase